LSLPTDPDFARIYIILTDGFISVEPETFDIVRNNIGTANFFAFGIGDKSNRYLIEGLAHVGKAEPFFATNQEEAIEVSQRLIEYNFRPGSKPKKDPDF
jgi:Ca-activated chloride channel homolog